MGNQSSTPSRRRSRSGPETTADRVKKVVGDVHEEIKRSVKKLDDDHPAAQLIDTVCGAYFDDDRYRGGRSASFYSEDAYSEDGSRTISEDDTYDSRSRRSRNDKSVDTQSYLSQSDNDTTEPKRRRGKASSFDTEDESKADNGKSGVKTPLASSFAKRCYFTKAGIGRTTQHYEGLTLTGNVVLMLASAMKLKGCPTICDEDLRRVEQTYPNQFSRLPDELLLSSGWRRISKYCHFSNKPIPDGVPFFHSKQRLHPSGGYYFLLASAIGMTRPLDVEPLIKDTLVLLETDYPSQCDMVPSVLIKDPEQWTLVDKFCFFSGGPINTEEDVYYQADFDGNPIFMLAFLSPSLTPEELYKLGDPENGLKSGAAVHEVESVYDLTERDFDDLKLYHLGPCRALPQYILQPLAWTKILPPHFLAARQQAMIRVENYEQRQGGADPSIGPMAAPAAHADSTPHGFANPTSPGFAAEFQREVEEEGAFHGERSHLAEAETGHAFGNSPSGHRLEDEQRHSPSAFADPGTPKMDPPDDQPPSLQKTSLDNISDPGDPEPVFSPDDVDVANNNAFFPDSPHLGDTAHVAQKAASIDDEKSAQLINLNSPMGLPPQPQYDPFDIGGRQQQEFAPVDHPQDEFAPVMDPHDTYTPAVEPNEFSPAGLAPAEFAPVEQPQDEPAPAEHTRDDEPKVEYAQAMNPPNTDRSEDEVQQADQPQDEYQFDQPPPHQDYDPGALQPHEQYYPDPTPTNHESETPQRTPTNHELETPQGHYPMPLSSADDLYGGEEKKMSMEQPEIDTNNVDFQPPQEYDMRDKTVDLAQTLQGRALLGSASGMTEPALSPASAVSEGSHQSAALRGAQEILKKNRQRKLEMAAKSKDPPVIADPGTPTPDDVAWDSGSDVAGSNVSGSSFWSNDSGTTGDRNSRRALILQMAKARMRTNKDSPSKASSTGASANRIHDDASSVGGKSEANTDIDIAGDLD